MRVALAILATMVRVDCESSVSPPEPDRCRGHIHATGDQFRYLARFCKRVDGSRIHWTRVRQMILKTRT